MLFVFLGITIFLIPFSISIKNKNVRVKLAKNILESKFTFLNNKLFFDDLSINDKTVIFFGVKILDLKGNELLYVNNLNINLNGYSQLKSKNIHINSIELKDPKLYLEKYLITTTQILNYF